MPNRDDDNENILFSMWNNSAGHHSMIIDEKSFAAIQRVLANAEIGGKFVYYNRKKEKKSNRDSDGMLKYITKEEVDANRAEYLKKKGGSNDRL